ncbi:hypothetical protein [Deinococcus soli (ex Cha et al. 2016)]|uniref:Uncharacterized protein n=2 Tax=Deinococcus soli (ex Cha et al. 2016) TaxID=1309411 RepID=A0AAE3XHT9_9DEIO|nr:hypothetical protein [Deinococcus soli (ex Cha et al. 2016)]MDR6221159.1 hypothetical protein [Deinococcus soli (ex Cha et al. 2016)]MDR6331092.1 hypothetical protein [Deinococcus soli (ex Cha et al. 2016)]MDR6754288.1 hypothetical protein [Deinococcus soli (ex Cha et al. 2016)]
MNVLYVDGTQALLLSPTKTAEPGPIKNLRAMASSIKAKGPTLLVLHGQLQQEKAPPAVPKDNLLPFLDTKFQSFVSTTPGSDTLFTLHDRALVAQVNAAARGTGLRITEVIPFASAALRAAGLPDSAVIIHPLDDTFEVTVASPAHLVTRSQARNDRQDLEKVAHTALNRPIANGDTPHLIVIGEPATGLTLPAPITATWLPLDVALRGAKVPAPKQPATAGGVVAAFSRRLDAATTIHPSLYVALAATAIINGGLFALATATKGQNAVLEGQRATLEQQALETQRLRARNEQLAAKVAQAQTLMSNKGPLAADLPLIAARASSIQGALVRLAGPNSPTETDTRAFGTAVDRTYDLSAVTRSPQDLVRAYQVGGLSVDVRNIACKAQSCDVTFRTAPISQAATPTPQAAPTPNATTSPGAVSGAATAGGTP